MKHIYTVTSKTKYYTNMFNLTYPNIAESSSDGMLNELKLPYDKLPLCFEILEDGWSIKIPQPVQYSLNLVDWVDLPKNTNTPTLNTGQRIFFKGYYTNMTFGSTSGFGKMSIQQKNCNVYGNIMSLLYGDDFYGKYEFPNNINYIFDNLFVYAYRLLNAKNLILPATKLTKYCYKYMFGSCNKLQTIPELPATTLAEGCYEQMFGGCELLCEPPKLPATKLAYGCYKGMFINCDSLMHTPELPATTLAEQCYYEMFSGCTSLTTAPQLNSIELASNCYYRMFNGCTSLTNVQSILPASNLKTWCYCGMFRNCTSLTTAPQLPSTTINGQCYYGMFDGCKSLTTAPELPATKLYVNCYKEMFMNCTSLTTAPELPATTLAEGCYSHMFYKCTSLTAAPIFIATSFGYGSYAYMLYGTQFIPDVSNIDFSNSSIIRSGICTGLFAGTNITDEYLNSILPKNPETGNIWLPVTSLSSSCYGGMFDGCKNITIAPELPATSLASSCYYQMFKDCTSITTAPELPATVLSSECYYHMFDGCTSLINVQSTLPATTLRNGCYSYMFQNCTSLITAPELPATALAQECYYAMFNGCTSLTTPPSKLLASTVYYRSYGFMFRSCTSLETSPEIRNITTFDSVECLSCMFYDCKNLKHITAVFEPDSSKMNSWVKNVASTGTFLKKFGTIWTIGDSGIPTGWEETDNITYVKRISFTITADDVPGRKTNTIITYTDVWECLTDTGETVEKTLTGTAISEEFPQNTSKTDTVQRTITYTHDGVTATTTITQGVWLDNYYSVNLNDNWQISSTILNPDNTTYDGVYESFSNRGVSSTAATMYIDIVGYETFTLYIRSYAESNYDYVMVSQLDQQLANNSSYSNTTLVKAHTRSKSNSGTTINDYIKVEFTNIDSNEHRICIVYRKDGSGNSGDDRGYVIIPKS